MFSFTPNKTTAFLHVSARGLQDSAFDGVHNQNSGLLDRPKRPLLVLSLTVKRAENPKECGVTFLQSFNSHPSDIKCNDSSSQ